MLCSGVKVVHVQSPTRLFRVDDLRCSHSPFRHAARDGRLQPAKVHGECRAPSQRGSSQKKTHTHSLVPATGSAHHTGVCSDRRSRLNVPGSTAHLSAAMRRTLSPPSAPWDVSLGADAPTLSAQALGGRSLCAKTPHDGFLHQRWWLTGAVNAQARGIMASMAAAWRPQVVHILCGCSESFEGGAAVERWAVYPFFECVEAFE